MTRKEKTKRLKAGLQRAKERRGQATGPFPYGTHDKNEKAVLKRIIHFRSLKNGKARMTFKAIADLLNNEGIPTRWGILGMVTNRVASCISTFTDRTKSIFNN